MGSQPGVESNKLKLTHEANPVKNQRLSDAMHRTITLAAALLICFSMPLCGFAQKAAGKRSNTSTDTDWIRLFDGKSFDGWYTFLQKHKKNEDPTKVFQVHDGVIHVYQNHSEQGDVPGGYLATDLEYANYHLRLEYKWGDKKFRPRAEQRRDAGLLYHLVGTDVVWPRCIECQIQENDTGDCFTVRGTQVETSVEIVNIETPGGPKDLPRYKPEPDGGVRQTIGQGTIARIVKSATHEQDGWNTVEVIVRGSDKAVHIINGHTVFEAANLRQLDTNNKAWAPLTKGRIALQAEFAEVLYRNIEIRPLAEGQQQP
jgi:Domain of Unknown Function (DUF1080)